MACETQPVSTISEGVQCELGCELFRNCLDSQAVRDVSSGSISTISLPQSAELDSKTCIKKCPVAKQHEGSTINYICGFCGDMFAEPEDMEKHGSKYHPGENPFKCFACGEVFPSWLGDNGFEAHGRLCDISSQDSVRENSFQCLGASFVNEVDGHHNKDCSSTSVCSVLEFCENVCGDCGLQLPSQVSYSNHCKSHNSSEPFKCIECVMRFKKRYHLELHLSSHLLINPYHCADCGKEFSFRWAMLVHLKVHGYCHDVTCAVCGETFLNEDYLANHKLLVHDEENMDFADNDIKPMNLDCISGHMCEVHCGEFLPCCLCKEAREKNYVSVDSDSSLFCGECHVKFFAEEDFQNHMQSHQITHPFKCEECTNTYRSILGLREHVSSSHGDLEVQWCEECGGNGYMHVSFEDECEVHDEDWSSTLNSVDVIQEMIESDEREDHNRESAIYSHDTQNQQQINSLPRKLKSPCSSDVNKSNKIQHQKDKNQSKQTPQSRAQCIKQNVVKKAKPRKKSEREDKPKVMGDKVRRSKRDRRAKISLARGKKNCC